MKIKFVQLYKSYFKENSLVNLIKSENILCEEFWFFKNTPDKMFLSKRDIIIQEIQCFFLLLINIKSFRNKKVICFGGHYALMLFTKILGNLLGKSYHLYLYNFYLHNLGEIKIIKKILHFLLSTQNTTLIVQSPDEVKYFNSLSKNPIYFIPYCESSDFNFNDLNTPNNKYLFTGGYTNRDYDLIFECARQNPSVKFVVVVSKLNDISGEGFPENINIYKEVDVLTFNGLLYRSFGVIIPLKENVGSSGQMLCIAAMKMAKPIIYCNISSINYYFKNADCGIPYSIGDISSLNTAVNKLFAAEFDSESMGKRALAHFSENYTLNKRNEKLFNLIMQS